MATVATSKWQKEVAVGTSLNLSTVHGSEVVSVTCIDRLVVECRSQTKSKNKTKWSQLWKIKEKKKVLLLNMSLNVALLIGSNCPKVIKPGEIIAGRRKNLCSVNSPWMVYSWTS